MNELNTRLTLTIAKELLARCQGERIPIKVDSSHRVGNVGKQQHWSKANLVGVKGKNILFRPINGHQRDEEAPASRVKIWQSRVSSKVMDIYRQLRGQESVTVIKAGDFTFETPFVPEVMLPAAVEPAIEVEIEIEEPVHEQVVAEVETSVEAIVEKEAPVMTEPKSANAFLDLVRNHEKLVEQIRTEAATSGAEALQKLRNDRDSALEMVRTIEQEISNLESLLQQFLPKAAQPTQPKSDLDDIFAEDTRKSLPDRETIIRALDRNWASPKSIKPRIGGCPVPFWQIISPLVQEGIVERDGKGPSTKYRLAATNGDAR